MEIGFVLKGSSMIIKGRGFSTVSNATQQSSSNSNKIKPKTAVVMMNLGGPEDQSSVKPFLHRLFSDREIIPLPFQKFLGPAIAHFRSPGIAKLYQGIGGGSPIRKWTRLQAEQMIKKLDEISPDTAPHKYYIAFRYADPLTDDTLMEMKKDGVERAVAFTQYPQFSCTTTGSSLNELWRGLKRTGLEDQFQWSIIDRWPVHKGFINAVAARVKEGIESFPKEVQDDVRIMFSAHSIPMKIVVRGDPYPQEVGATVHRVMEEIHDKYSKFNQYILTWQSAVGPSAWLGPQTIAAVEKYAKHGVKALMVVPIAFTSDHIETLSEIDIEIAHKAKEVGIEHYKRSPSLNDSLIFTDAMADIVSAHLHQHRLYSRQYKARCPGCTNDQCRNIINPVPGFVG